MVKPCQMKNAVQGQDLHFLGGGVPETGRILPGNVGRDCNVSR